MWKNLFESQGWLYDKEEMDAYLEETSKEEISYANSSGNHDSATRSKNSDNIISSIPITRTSSALISPNSLSVLSSLKNRLSPSVQHAQSNKVKNKTNVLANRQVISFGDHYNPRTDMRFINWKKLYEKRYMIEQRWLSGQCKMYSFPPLPCPSADLHTEGIYCLQLDKKKMVTGSRDKTIKIWDLETGSCKMTITGHTRSVLCLQYDNDTIVSGSSDATLIVTELETGKLKQKLLGHEDSVLNLRLVKSDRIISCSKDRTVRLWDKNTGQCLRVYQGHRAAVNAVQWLNHTIVSASGDRTIKMWDMETGKCLRTLIAHTRGVACIEFDGERIVSGSSDKTIKVWDANTGDCIYTLAGHTELVRTIQLDSVADRIISGCYDGQLKVWDLKEGRLLRDLGQAVDGR